ncbi:synaptic vesicle 2-related protein-like [Orbicella faveolata]|uniref:synaptic vesicle 2-related protein-like n=1 Tax=Orbicella faveolata TaxID=48498 RepID=UPI0009E41F9F|nr:synaptic vesicle 2-related protein-like [Orbicella faveolata]
MAMSGYFTEGQPSPGVHSPPTLSDHDRDSLSKEPLELSSGKTYDTIKGKTDDSGELTYTLSEAVEKIGFGKFQIRILLMVGFFTIADALEMMLLSILAPTIRCIWHLPSWKEALVTTVVFVGMMFGSSFWGWLADNYGRKFVSFLNTVVFVGMMFGSSFWGWLADNYGRKFFFWAIGSVFTVAVAMAVMPTLGWRWLLGFLSLPLLFFVLMSYSYIAQKISSTCTTSKLSVSDNTSVFQPQTLRFEL